MFKRTRRRIVAAIMGALVILLALTLFIINISSYYEVRNQNDEMLAHYVQTYDPERNILKNNVEQYYEAPLDKTDLPPNGENEPSEEVSVYRLSTFYSVAFLPDGDVLAVNNGRNTVFSDDELVSIANDILAQHETIGYMDNLSYRVKEKNGYTLVAFIDNTVMNNGINTLMHTTIIAGGVALFLLFVTALFLSRRIVEPLEESDRMQRQFISDAGHELKTPLAVIGTNTEILSRNIGDNEWLENIEYENERMSTLVARLLNLARAENTQNVSEFIDLSHLVTGEILPFESMAFEKGRNISAQIDSDIQVMGNSEQLKQLTDILIDNAICHSEGEGDIEISLSRQHRFAVLSVLNRAPDISDKDREHLFERFYRIDRVRNSDDDHYGLGLPIAKAIVDNHKGNISVESTNGKVTFKVMLPLKNGKEVKA